MANSDSTSAPGSGKLTENDLQIGRRVRQLRVRAGISQHEFALVLGVSYQALSKYERGTSRISAGRLVSIAQGLGIDPAELLGAPDMEPTYDRQVYRLVKLFKNLNASQRGSILDLLRALQPSNDR